MSEITEEMKQLGLTPERLKRWQEEEDEGFVGAGLGTLRDIAEYARRCEELKGQETTDATKLPPPSLLSPRAGKK